MTHYYSYGKCVLRPAVMRAIAPAVSTTYDRLKGSN